MLKIDHGITHYNPTRFYDEIFKDLKIGDSFVKTGTNEVAKYRTALLSYSRRHDKNWEVRTKKEGINTRLFILQNTNPDLQ